MVAGWFSLQNGGATAGDLLVRDVVREWLEEDGIAYDVAQPPPLGQGVNWYRVSPRRYTHLVFACGPVGPDLAVRPLIERFAACRRIAVNVSVTGAPGWSPFEVLLERDGRGSGRPDLAIAAEPPRSPASAPPPGRPPVVAVVRIHRQAEYPSADPDNAHRAFDRLLAGTAAAAFTIDTVLDPSTPGRRTPGEVGALLAKADVVLTTRLHGLVLALAQGVPAIAVDPVHGGAKVLAQAQALRWPAVLTLDTLDQAALERLWRWALTAAARRQAETSAEIGLAGVQRIKASLLSGLRSRR